MSMNAGGGGRGGGGSNFRTFQQDSSVKEHKLREGTVKRILAFARPYKGKLAVFLTLIAFAAAISAAQPMLFRLIIDDGITAANRNVVIMVALVIAGLALVNAAL
jgi:ATP-binding cassette subfamily B protein